MPSALDSDPMIRSNIPMRGGIYIRRKVSDIVSWRYGYRRCSERCQWLSLHGII